MGKSDTRVPVGAFDARSAARICGFSVHMINYLCRTKIVVPSAQKKRGRGVKRQYSYADLLLLRIIAQLLKQGISALRLKQSFRALQARGRSGSELISKKFVLTDGKDIFFEDNGALELLSSGQLSFAFVLELEPIRVKVRGLVSGKIRAA